ncbi:hypothetical protein ACFW2X_02230 [Streptomyces antibioticus]|uniref:hypothetical protein n=1 Tax=Streptomyces antibioticus TaxID=1890 RepID=UPI0036CEF9E4
MTERLNDNETGPALAGGQAVPAQLRSRRLASLRRTPLACGHRDPFACVAPHGNSSYGLTARELRAEIDRLTARGWSVAEVATRLNLREVATA